MRLTLGLTRVRKDSSFSLCMDVPGIRRRAGEHAAEVRVDGNMGRWSVSRRRDDGAVSKM